MVLPALHACSVLWVFCLVCAQLLPGAFALTGKKTLKVMYISKVDSFVFDRDGTLDFFTTGTDLKGQYMAIVDNTEIQSPIYSSKSICELVSSNNSTYNSVFKYVLPLEEQQNLNITTRGSYSFFVINCREKPTAVTLTISYTAKNGGSHLPYNTKNMVWTSVSLTSVWILVCVLLVYFPAILFMYRTGCNLMSLQAVVQTVMSIKITTSMLMSYYWYAYATYGVNHTLFYQLLCDFSVLVEMTVLYIILFLAVTWNPSAIRMPPFEKRKLLFFFFISIIGALFLSRPNDNLIALCLLLVCLFLAPIAINSIRFRIRQLVFYQLVVERLRIFGISEDTFNSKIRSYWCICAATTLYFLTRLFVFFINLIWTWWYIEWVTILVNECAVLVMCIVMLYYLMMPMTSPIFSSQAEVDTISRLESWIEQNIQREIENDQQQQAEEEPWDMSSTIVVEWPSSATFPSNEGGSHDSSGCIRPLSVCIKEDNDKLSSKW